jgi:antibiotic biosynthesis monooxygenase (ABM) superfamily enzyme
VTSNPVIWTVGLQCLPEDDEEFNAWYDDVHVPMLLKGGHVAKVTRYKLASQTYDVAPGAMTCPTYQTIYEFDDEASFESWMRGDDRAAAGEDKAKTWAGRPYDVIWAARYDLMNTRTASTNQPKG